MTKVYSFDIFDTCLIRKCGDAYNLFDILAYEILGDDSPESVRMDFTNIRILAEQNTKCKTDSEEITLDDIYENCDFSDITNLSTDSIRKSEILLEKKMLSPVMFMVEKINSLRENGAQIFYISDMYLPTSVILDVLVREKLFLEGDKLYVSSEVGLRKSTGNLFKYICKENNLNFKDWTHYGDNVQSDIRSPNNLGIKTKLVDYKYSLYESIWIENSYAPSFQYSATLAGVSKSIRLSHKNDIQIEFSSTLIAPIYVCHVLRILNTAKKNKIDKLFFLARDGYVLYLIAKKFQTFFPQIKLEYIYVSRKSLYLPGIFNVNEVDFFNLLNPEIGQTFREILDRLSIDFLNITDEDFLSQKLDESNFNLLEAFLQKKEVITFIEEKSDITRKLLIEYFIQEGLASNDSKNAIVDLRGTRTSHKLINDILRSTNFREVEGFYFEVVKDRKQISTAGMYYSDFYREKLVQNSNLNGIFQHYFLLEQFFSSTDQQRTIGYTKQTDTNKIVPLFENEISQEKLVEISKIQHSTIEEFADIFIQTKLYKYVDVLYHTTVIPIVCSFGNKPHKRYLKALEGFYLTNNKYSYKEYLKNYDFKDWIHVFLFSRKLQTFGYWYVGSLYLNLNQYIVDSYFLVFKIVRKFKRILKL